MDNCCKFITITSWVNFIYSNSKSSSIELHWQTETEVDNYGFDIERSTTDDNWEKIGFVEGHGNSNSPKLYAFTDKNPAGGSIFNYRLKQIDTDGKFEYSNIIEVELIPNEFVLYQNYPNPFNPTTTIKYALPFESMVKIVLYNSLGEQVEVILNKTMPRQDTIELNLMEANLPVAYTYTE